MDFLPYGRHELDDNDISAVCEVLRGGWLTQGPAVERFERAVADYCGARFAVACSSGTAALHLAMLAADVGQRDTIVSPAVTFLATANCGRYVGADVRFTDIDYATGLMTAPLLAPHLNDRTRAVLPVHFAGAACDMESIAALLRERCPRAVLVEDACHALGGQHARGLPIGALRWSEMAVFSFHPVKHVAAGEGGMVLTDDAVLAERLRRFRSHGMTKDAAHLTRWDEGPWYYEMHELGFNYRLSDINCALAASQFQKLDRFLRRRQELAERYNAAFAGLPHVAIPPRNAEACAWHLYYLHLDFDALGATRRQVVAQLAKQGVGTQVHYFPVPLQPYYRQRYGYRAADFSQAVTHYERALTLPLYPAMTDADADRVIAAVGRLLSGDAALRKIA